MTIKLNQNDILYTLLEKNNNLNLYERLEYIKLALESFPNSMKRSKCNKLLIQQLINICEISIDELKNKEEKN